MYRSCTARRAHAGFFADQLHDVLQQLPPWLWPETRAKRTYVNQVLARAEVHSSYQPARRLWVRTKNGHYFPHPEMQLRSGEGWQPVYEQMALTWIDRGCGREIDHRPRPAASIQWAREALARATEPEPPAAEPEPPPAETGGRWASIAAVAAGQLALLGQVLSGGSCP